MSRASLIIRSLFLLGFVLAMPLLALPSVARWADEILYGGAEPTPTREELNVGQDRSSADEKVAQVNLETPLAELPLSRAKGNPAGGLDSVGQKPPQLAPIPEFPESPFDDSHSVTIPIGPTGAPNPSLDLQFSPADFSASQPQRSGSAAQDQAAAEISGRIGEIRQRLEDLGADYIALAVADDTGQYRFQCRMLVTPGSAETEPFEASGKNATDVAEQVLKAVEGWRASQASQVR